MTITILLTLLTYQTTPTSASPPVSAPTSPARAESLSAADVIVLRDGSVLLGQVERLGRQGELGVLARRAWVETNLPEPAKRWAREEAERVNLARLQRRERLFAWRDARTRGDGNGGLVGAWINQEFSRVADSRPPRTVLMEIVLERADVARVERREAETARLLRLGWRAEVPEIEAMSADELRDALVFQDALVEGDPGRLERLLPIRSEPDARWRLRRATTEAVAEPDLRSVRFRWFLLPESGPQPDLKPPGSTTAVLDSLPALEAFQSIQAVRPADPVALRLAEVASAGRVGAIVSRVEFTRGFSGAEAESSLWVRREGGGWSAEFTRRGEAQVDEPPDPDGPIADAAPIRSALLVLEMVASTPSPPEVSRRRQAAGTAAQRALGRARAALDEDLGSAILPIFRPAR